MSRSPFTITLDQDHPRLDRFLAVTFGDFSRTQWEQVIQKGEIKVNGSPVTKNGYALSAGDCVEGHDPLLPPDFAWVTPQNLPLDVLFEDEHVLVINKPTDQVVHPGPGHPDGTILNAFLGHIQSQACSMTTELASEDIDDEGLIEPLPGLVHRLDRFTTGCLCLTKTAAAQAHLQAQFKNRHIKKFYLALIRLGKKHSQFQQLFINEPIARDKRYRLRMGVQGTGRPSQTRVTLLHSVNGVGVVLCELLTGRTHQIRVHLSHEGMPLLGDPLYGGVSVWKNEAVEAVTIPHPMLHAWSLGFTHPTSGIFHSILAPVPTPFINLMTQLGLKVPEKILASGPMSE